jgi:hypothetical protein
MCVSVVQIDAGSCIPHLYRFSRHRTDTECVQGGFLLSPYQDAGKEQHADHIVRSATAPTTSRPCQWSRRAAIVLESIARVHPCLCHLSLDSHTAVIVSTSRTVPLQGLVVQVHRRCMNVSILDPRPSQHVDVERRCQRLRLRLSNAL